MLTPVIVIRIEVTKFNRKLIWLMADVCLDGIMLQGPILRSSEPLLRPVNGPLG